ncbi:TolC family protein (plasmid) [Phyllobacterium sp. 628]|uniref:TolC family protein n=1 Tax=Phyllobacterium sp. 628 TaxID=2718938 RepID=UPI0016624989|nr:TolC family protein [Phyllobacterium sp. 628]QND55118.1 TolC family protein [Phyllobacterium sp. 628]
MSRSPLFFLFCNPGLKIVPVVALAMSVAACQSDVSGLAVSAPDLPMAYASAAKLPGKAQRDARLWWQVFGDPVLSALVARSLEQNLTIAQAKQQLIAARTMVRASKTLFMPTADISGTANAGTGSTKSDELMRRPMQLNLEAGWEIGLFGLRENTQRSANASADMVAEDAEAARIAVAAEIAGTYVRLRALQEREAIASASLALLGRDGQLATVKYRSGLATASDAEEARISLGDARVEGVKLRTQIESTLQQIATLLGTSSIDSSLRQPRPQPVAKLDPAIGRPTDLLRARPDIRRAELATVRAAAEIGIAQADLYPKLRLSGMIGIGGPASGSLFGVMGGPSIQIPLLDQGRRRAVVAARQAQFEETAAAYKHSVLAAYEEASTALQTWSAGRSAVHQFKQTLAAVRKIQAESAVLERAGLSDQSKQTANAIRVLGQRRQLAEAQEAEALALIAFYKAIGGASPLSAGMSGANTVRQRKQ